MDVHIIDPQQLQIHIAQSAQATTLYSDSLQSETERMRTLAMRLDASQKLLARKLQKVREQQESANRNKEDMDPLVAYNTQTELEAMQEECHEQISRLRNALDEFQNIQMDMKQLQEKTLACRDEVLQVGRTMYQLIDDIVAAR